MNRKRQLIIKKTASLQNTFLLGLLFLILGFFIMPEASKQIKQYGYETDLVDVLFYYSPDQVHEMMANYNEKGRNLYIAVEATADLFFSIVIAAFLSSFLVWSTIKLGNKSIEIKYLILFPFLGMIANFLENGGIIWMLVNYPEKYFFFAIFTSVFTTSKWLLIAICVFIAAWNLTKLSYLNFTFSQKTEPKESIVDTK